MGNTVQLTKNGQPVFPVTDVSLVMGLQDAIKLPPVKVTTLPTASAETAGKMYYVGPDANDEYERYITSATNGSYEWIDLGDTSIPLPSIADNLTTDDANTALSAKQGKVLNEELGELEADLTVLSDKNILVLTGRTDASPTGSWPITKYDVTERKWYRGLAYSGYFQTTEANKVSITSVNDNGITFVQPSANFGLGFLVKVKPDTDYVLSIGSSSGSPTRRVIELASDGTVITNYGPGSLPATFKTGATTEYIILLFYSTANNKTITLGNIQLEEGTAPTVYEPAKLFITTAFNYKEDKKNKVQTIGGGDSEKYPSTKAVSDYVSQMVSETKETLSFTSGTELNEDLFDVKVGDIVVLNTTASFPNGLHIKVKDNGTDVQSLNIYAAVSNRRIDITAAGKLNISASSSNSHNATILVSLFNYGGVINRLVSVIGNYEQDTASFELTNPAVKGFIDDVTYDNSDYSYTDVDDYNAKTVYRTDWPVPVVIKWTPEDVLETFILVSENTPVTPVTWNSNEAPKSDFWYRVPGGVFSYEVYNLIPGKTYYYGVYGVTPSGVKTIKEGTFATTGTVRMLKVDNAQNIRDLGGWTANGGTVAYDKIFRGDALDEPERLNHLSQAGVLELGVRIVIREEIDLRGASSWRINTSGEIVNASPIGNIAEYYPKSIQPYVSGLNNSGANIADIFEKINASLTESKPRKVYFHCSGGCDRTGTLAFLLLGLLGVSESDLSKEYELSTFANALGYPLGKYRTRNSTVYPFPDMVAAIKLYNGATLADKIETYLLGVGVSAATISSLRSQLIVA